LPHGPIIACSVHLKRYLVVFPNHRGCNGFCLRNHSYGQIWGAVGSQLSNPGFMSRLTTSFGVAMGFPGMTIITNLITSTFTWPVDVDTRKLERTRLAAAKENQLC
jgi:hypothetical protein